MWYHLKWSRMGVLLCLFLVKMDKLACVKRKKLVKKPNSAF